MFKENEMCAAIERLFNLYGEDDLCDEDGTPYYKRLCLPDVCMMLRAHVIVPYEYTVETNMERGFKYCGAELFNQRACKVLSDIDVLVSDTIDSHYSTELWLLEDMTFVSVHCVTLLIRDSSGGFYESEYRTVVKPVTEYNDLFFTAEDLEEELAGLCEEIWERKATIYEM